jgi:hypothetical protein
MHRSPGSPTALGRIAWWGLPWLLILLVPVGAAYATTVALTSRLPVREAPTSIVADAAPVHERVRSADASTPKCDADEWLLYVGVGTWIHDPTAPCYDRAP